MMDIIIVSEISLQRLPNSPHRILLQQTHLKWSPLSHNSYRQVAVLIWEYRQVPFLYRQPLRQVPMYVVTHVSQLMHIHLDTMNWRYMWEYALTFKRTQLPIQSLCDQNLYCITAFPDPSFLNIKMCGSVW